MRLHIWVKLQLHQPNHYHSDGRVMTKKWLKLIEVSVRRIAHISSRHDALNHEDLKANLQAVVQHNGVKIFAHIGGDHNSENIFGYLYML